MKCVFALSTGRSGTHFLYQLARRNLADAVCRHEPYFDWGNPSMFGLPIEARARGNLAYVREQLEQKSRYVHGRRCAVYFESSHAFLKSYYDLAPDYFADIKVFHLVRDPIKTARSEANREVALDRFHFPFRRYRGFDGNRYYRWSLTGHEPIYESFRARPLSLFQFYLVQWIEIQNRAVEFLDRFDKHDDCVTLDSPRELNQPHTMGSAFAQLGLEFRGAEVVIAGGMNRTPLTPTHVTTREWDEAAQVLEQLPDEYLRVFQQPLFARFAWTAALLNRFRDVKKTTVS